MAPEGALLFERPERFKFIHRYFYGMRLCELPLCARPGTPGTTGTYARNSPRQMSSAHRQAVGVAPSTSPKIVLHPKLSLLIVHVPLRSNTFPCFHAANAFAKATPASATIFAPILSALIIGDSNQYLQKESQPVYLTHPESYTGQHSVDMAITQTAH